MALFRRKIREETPKRSAFHELEQLGLKLRRFLLGAPLLLLVGFGAGEAAKRTLRIPEQAEARHAQEAGVPRVRLDALSDRMRDLRDDGERTVDYVTMYTEHVEPIEKVLTRRGVSSSHAREISWPLVEESYRKGLDPAMVVSVLLVESGGKPTARSPVGARGLMQVMPFWAGNWRSCGRDLYDIRDNLCTGTSILAWYLRSRGTEREALLGYNGCVRGTNTPNCETYPNKIWNLRRQVEREIEAARQLRAQPVSAD